MMNIVKLCADIMVNKDKYKTNTIIRLDDITPQDAADVISKFNGKNRKPTSLSLKPVVDSMKAGEWCNKSTQGLFYHIKLDGNIASGQHRLKAAMSTGTTLKGCFAIVVDTDQWTAMTEDKRPARSIVEEELGLSSQTIGGLSESVDMLAKKQHQIKSDNPKILKAGNAKKHEMRERISIIKQDPVYEVIVKLHEEYGQLSKKQKQALSVLLYAGVIVYTDVSRLTRMSVSNPGNSLLFWVLWYYSVSKKTGKGRCPKVDLDPRYVEFK